MFVSDMTGAVEPMERAVALQRESGDRFALSEA